jgi:GntR family transcriptional regulator
MHLHVSPADGVPIYLQIVNQVRYLVSSGRLAAGEELPPIRALAEQLLINPNTVARAYRELELAGSRGETADDGNVRIGRRVAAGAARAVEDPGRRVDALLAEARQMDVSLDDVLDLVRQRDRAMASA